MRKLIIGILALALIIGGSIFLVFSRHQSLTVTYIRFDSNLDFILGINNKDVIVSYIPLNDESKIFNLEMFNEKLIEDGIREFCDKCNSENCLKNNTINLTIITKNVQKVNNIYDKITRTLDDDSYDIAMNLTEPTVGDLLTYSNETIYNVNSSLTDEDLATIGNQIKEKITNYVQDKIDGLIMNQMSLESKKKIIDINLSEGYFNDYNFKELILDNYDVRFSSQTKYVVNFNNDQELDFITINICFDYYKEIDNNAILAEEYIYDYNDKISNKNNNFYTFNY